MATAKLFEVQIRSQRLPDVTACFFIVTPIIEWLRGKADMFDRPIDVVVYVAQKDSFRPVFKHK